MGRLLKHTNVKVGGEAGPLGKGVPVSKAVGEGGLATSGSDQGSQIPGFKALMQKKMQNVQNSKSRYIRSRFGEEGSDRRNSFYEKMQGKMDRKIDKRNSFYDKMKEKMGDKKFGIFSKVFEQAGSKGMGGKFGRMGSMLFGGSNNLNGTGAPPPGQGNGMGGGVSELAPPAGGLKNKPVMNPNKPTMY